METHVLLETLVSQLRQAQDDAKQEAQSARRTTEMGTWYSLSLVDTILIGEA